MVPCQVSPNSSRTLSQAFTCALMNHKISYRSKRLHLTSSPQSTPYFPNVPKDKNNRLKVNKHTYFEDLGKSSLYSLPAKLSQPQETLTRESHEQKQ